MVPNDTRQGASNAEDDLVLVDDLLSRHAKEESETALIAYPVNAKTASSFKVYTARELEGLVSNATMILVENGLTRQTGLDGDPAIVGLLGRSDLEYLVTLLALSRLCYTVLLLSPRLTLDAYLSLINETNCNDLVHSWEYTAKVDEIKHGSSLRSWNILSQDDLKKHPLRRNTYSGESREPYQGQKTAFILHSSGSTGLPKCIHLTHAACLHNFSLGYSLQCLLTLPLYHMHGHSSLFRAMYNRKTCFMYNASLPLTTNNLVAAISLVRPELLLTVPYGLKLLSESQVGIDSLRSCKVVSFAGSACPDELGHRLAARDIRLASTYGL